jgi:hypothetical protein
MSIETNLVLEEENTILVVLTFIVTVITYEVMLE